MKDLKALEKRTGIPAWRFKRALGIALEPCAATTVEEAREAYDSAPCESEAEEAAFRKWNELSLAEVEAATTIGEAREAYSGTPLGSEAEMVALRKIHELF